MDRLVNSSFKRMCLIILTSLIMSILGITTQAPAAVSSVNNNFTMINGSGGLSGGTNDVVFTWDGTKKTSVVASGQVSNATLSSTTPFLAFTWSAHDVAIYGPGTYTVYDGCPAGGPGCGTGNPITITVGTGQLGFHMLFDWGGNDDIDVVDVWAPNAVFGPSPLFTGPDGTIAPFGNPATVWSYMSSDWNGDGFNGFGMTDGPLIGFNANFNVNVVGTTNNNFTMLDPTGALTGGTNDVVFTWNGTKKTSVAASGQISNATLSNVTHLLFLTSWSAHDVALYGPGTYTVFDGCAAGSPGCGTGIPITFTVGAGQLGAHILYDWGGDTDVDVVDVWAPNAVFGPSLIFTGPDGGTVDPAKIWDWMSSDWNGDGFNGSPMTDGSFAGFSANYNVMGIACTCNCDDNNACTNDICDQANNCTCMHATVNCDDNDICTTDACNTATGCVHTATVPVSCNDNNVCSTDGCTANACTHTSIVCNDNNACTTDTCNSATGCVFTPLSCDDNNVCTTDTCNTTTGCIHTAISCNDNNACTTDTCNTATGCVFTPIVCNDNNACTTNACDTSTGCVYTPISCNDNNLCTIDSCNPVIGCFYTLINCNDNNACTTDTCNTATGCVSTPIVCDDNNACTTDTCNTASGCVFTPISCNDNNACTTDTCNTATGCVSTLISCNDNNACTTDTCDTATGCVFTAIVCNDNSVCTTDTCNPATGCVFTPISCDDNNPCTADTCNAATGCAHTPLSGHEPCDDNSLCTTNDGCVSGVCVGTPKCDDHDICTRDTCDPATGVCSHVATVPTQCNDNNVCTTDGCTADACTHTAVSCNDNNACTIDTCNTSTGGCVHTALSCDDNNSCTTDTCNTATGCIHTPRCADGDLDNVGGVTVADALMALQIVEGVTTPNASQLRHGDVAPLINGVPHPDGKITIGDVVVILRRAVGLVNF